MGVETEDKMQVGFSPQIGKLLLLVLQGDRVQMNKYVKMANNMREFDELDEEGQNSVKVACVWGIVAGGFLMLIPAFCVVAIAIAVVTQ